jgi:hypothetical protein
MTTENFQEAFEITNELLRRNGLEALCEKEARQDWGIQGGETYEDLENLVFMFKAEYMSYNAEHKDTWMYQF